MITLCFTSAVALPARAEMPNYNTDGYCKRIAAVGGAPSQNTMNYCLRQEQSAYNELKPRWDALPAAMRSYCDRIAKVGGDGSFNTLKYCVAQEETAAQANGQFQFKR